MVKRRGEGRDGKGRGEKGLPSRKCAFSYGFPNRIPQIHVVGGLVPSLIRLGINSSDNFEMCKIAQRGHVPRFPARGGGWGREERGKGRRGRRRVFHVIERVSQREMSLRHSVVESTTEDLLLKMSY